jgi:hypothetical protein
MAKRLCFLLLMITIMLPIFAADYEESPSFEYIGLALFDN